MRSLRSGLYLSVATFAVTAVLTATPANAAITVTSATMNSGKLIVSGTASVGSQITLDSKYTRTISSDKKFSFSIEDYHPDDCVIRLKTNFSHDPVVTAVIAMCGERGLNPRGVYAAANSYKEDDLVTHQGSSWIAKKSVSGSTPGSAPGRDGQSYWLKYVSKGDKGDDGHDGDDGDDGDDGHDGDDGAIGPTGPAGPAGPDRSAGPVADGCHWRNRCNDGRRLVPQGPSDGADWRERSADRCHRARRVSMTGDERRQWHTRS